MPVKQIEFPLKHPPMMVRSVEADQLIQQMFCPAESAVGSSTISSRIAGRVRRLVQF
jgi:hypothetical protein